MAQQFTAAPNSPNPYVTYTLNNINLVKTMNKERKDWTKKYYEKSREWCTFKCNCKILSN